MTLRVTKPRVPSDRGIEVEAPAVVLEARSLASGTVERIGLPTGGDPSSPSTGLGSGGGAGTGIGTGIGPGHGPGVGPGFEGGFGGGIYRPGGQVTTPRLITEVKPKYTQEALLARIEGAVLIELVVMRNGRPEHARIVRSLDPRGLDVEAIKAVREWRFEPGRLAGAPVDVLVTVVMDFTIR